MNKNIHKLYILGIVAFCFMTGAAIVLLGEYRHGPQSPSDKIQVSASFYPLAFFAENIGGDFAQVTNITPAGAEPHDYEPTVSDTAKIETSRLLILNGGWLEAWGDDVKKNLDPSRTVLVVAGEGLTTQHVTEDGEEIIDPHIWLDPKLAEEMVDKIALGFIAADGQHHASYEANAATLKTQLERLDQEYRDGLQNCAQNDIVTSHAAFGYLATEYHFNQIPIAGLSPDTEPSPRQLADITDFVREHDVHYIFFEDLVSPKLAQTIATETGAQTMVLSPIEGLTPDALTAGRNYFIEMERNLNHLEIALQCVK